MVIRRLIYALLIVLVAGSILLTAALHVQRWLLELLVSFAPIVTVLLFVGLLVTLLITWRIQLVTVKPVVASLVVIFVLSVYCAQFILTVGTLTPHTASSNSKQISFTTFNKEFTNNDVQAAGNYIRQHAMDIVALQETTPTLTKQVSAISGLRQYYVTTQLVMVEHTGTAILSRYPITSTKTLSLPSRHSSLIKAVVRLPNNKSMAFYSLHLSGPFSSSRYGYRKIDSRAVTQILQQEKLPYVLGGDFNTTPYSPSARAFTSALKHKQQEVVTERPAKCTRFSHLPFTCLKIDHIYLPNDSKLVRTYISPNLGSDHRAYSVEFRY